MITPGILLVIAGGITARSCATAYRKINTPVALLAQPAGSAPMIESMSRLALAHADRVAIARRANVALISAHALAIFFMVFIVISSRLRFDVEQRSNISAPAFIEVISWRTFSG